MEEREQELMSPEERAKALEEAEALGVSVSRFMEHLGEAPPGELIRPGTNGTY